MSAIRSGLGGYADVSGNGLDGRLYPKRPNLFERHFQLLALIVVT
jgi:hypothetical protein